MASEQRSLREKGIVGAKRIQRDLEIESRSCLDVLNKGYTSSGIYTLQMDIGSVQVTIIYKERTCLYSFKIFNVHHVMKLVLANIP